MGVFVIQNSDGFYLNRESVWGSAEPCSELFFSPHKDVALNQLLEINSQDILLRASVVECPADPRGRPLIDENDKPGPAAHRVGAGLGDSNAA